MSRSWEAESEPGNTPWGQHVPNYLGPSVDGCLPLESRLFVSTNSVGLYTIVTTVREPIVLHVLPGCIKVQPI
ncbi:hypothetical protein PSEEN4755 [Pseudomonas entomophila L48]|uniref:Uncharacterized protein n=1 Tax=Pseudomonas entomophila (strain L48) TaxID=384676 RepID=Q1I4M3_PSEE4|nr:hypothetical protein PSEEN4755 [Pseudomonas entomophila L48]